MAKLHLGCNKGSMILLVMISTLMAASVGISGVIAIRRENGINNAITAFRDIKYIIEGCNSFYSDFLENAGNYTDTYSPTVGRDIAREETIKSNWDTQNTMSTFSSKEESLETFLNRTGINLQGGDPCTNKVYKEISVSTKVNKRHNKWSELAIIPESWAIKITLKTRGPKDFDANELKRLLGRYERHLQAGNIKGGNSIVVTFKELKPNTLTVIIAYRLASEQSVIMSN